MPLSLPPCDSSSHATSRFPAGSAATPGEPWSEVVYVLTWNSGPTGTPASVNRWAYTPSELPSWPEKSVHTTMKFPAAAAATPGEPWSEVVYVLTWNPEPGGCAAASNRRANTSLPDPEAVHVTTNSPLERIVRLSEEECAGVACLTRES